MKWQDLVKAGSRQLGSALQDRTLLNLISKSELWAYRYREVWSVLALKQKHRDGLFQAMRKGGSIFDHWMDANWAVCKRLFQIIGPAHDEIDATIHHPEAAEIAKWIAEFGNLVGAPASSKIKIFDNKDHGEGFGRSYYTEGDASIHLRVNVERPTIWHELGHWIEDTVPGMHDAAISYLNGRAHGGPLVKLIDVDSRPGYRADEKAYVDGFFDVYTGKRYKNGTELISMGLQALVENPVDLIRRDPQLAAFIIGVVEQMRKVVTD